MRRISRVSRASRVDRVTDDDDTDKRRGNGEVFCLLLGRGKRKSC